MADGGSWGRRIHWGARIARLGLEGTAGRPGHSIELLLDNDRRVCEHAGLGDDVELRVVDGAIVVERFRRPRERSAEAAALAARSDIRPLDPSTATRFDEEVWAC